MTPKNEQTREQIHQTLNTKKIHEKINHQTKKKMEKILSTNNTEREREREREREKKKSYTDYNSKANDTYFI